MDEKRPFYECLDPESEQIMMETSTVYKKNDYMKFDGFVLPQSIKNYIDKIRTVEIRDDDVWLCTFAKSGTTWTQELLWCSANGIDHKDVKNNIDDRFPFFEFSALFDVTEDLGLPKDTIEGIKKLASPRFIKTHLPFNLLPEKLQNFSTGAKIIHVSRNPRDLVISCYNFCKLIGGCTGSFAQYVDRFFRGLVSYGPFPAHLQGYLAHNENPKILFLRYEEMQKDLKSVICRTANFIGQSTTENDVAKLVDHLSFSNMKQNPAVNHESFVKIMRNGCPTNNEEEHFMRRGIVGDWKEKFDSELYQRFLKWEAENLSDVDFTFSV